MEFFMLIFVAFILFLGFVSVRIIRQSTVGMVERLGKFHRQLSPGIHIVWPMLDSLRHKVDLRTQVLDSPSQPVITADNVGMHINTVTWFRVVDPFKAVYEIEYLEEAILNIIATTLRDIFGGLELDQTYTSREQINTKLRVVLDEATDNWGVRIERVEVKDIDPPKDIRESMERQMRAERERREAILRSQGVKESQVLEAEGRKQSQILDAEAEKEAAILTAEAEKEAAIRKAEGDAQAMLLVAEAEKQRIAVVYKALKDADLDEAILNLESIQALKKMAESDNKMLVPYEASALMGAFKSLKEFGKSDEK